MSYAVKWESVFCLAVYARDKGEPKGSPIPMRLYRH